MCWPVQGLARSAVAVAVMRDAAETVGREKNIWSSKASAETGQPWLKTKVCTLSQSLY
jgi:hypothetical protein